jgi:hypothetical protein
MRGVSPSHEIILHHLCNQSSIYAYPVGQSAHALFLICIKLQHLRQELPCLRENEDHQ